MQDLLDILPPGSREYELARTLDAQRLPAHVGIIMDGNGRWARRRSCLDGIRCCMAAWYTVTIAGASWDIRLRIWKFRKRN